jgi:hypothetical protein
MASSLHHRRERPSLVDIHECQDSHVCRATPKPGDEGHTTSFIGHLTGFWRLLERRYDKGRQRGQGAAASRVYRSVVDV